MMMKMMMMVIIMIIVVVVMATVFDIVSFSVDIVNVTVDSCLAVSLITHVRIMQWWTRKKRTFKGTWLG